MEQKLDKIIERLAKIDGKIETLATKEELKATNDDIAKITATMATEADLANMATKSDIREMGGKSERLIDTKVSILEFN